MLITTNEWNDWLQVIKLGIELKGMNKWIEKSI